MRDERDSKGIADLESQALVPLPREAAFELFTRRFAEWWPREFSWSGADDLEDIGIEPRPGGFLYEKGPHGFRLDWGRITAWDEPERLAFTWQIGPDRVPVPNPARASEVEIRFEEVDERSTLLRVHHRHWERHGDDAQVYRENFDVAWPYIMQALVERAESA